MLTNYIAHLCPLAAGPSVYRARDMYALINDTLQYSDSTVCAFAGYFRESANTLYPNLNKLENAINYFKAQPNPASEEVIFSLNENESAGQLTIYNLNGASVYSATLNAGMNKLPVNVANFSCGIYVAHYVNNEVSYRVKLTVNK